MRDPQCQVTIDECLGSRHLIFHLKLLSLLSSPEVSKNLLLNKYLQDRTACVSGSLKTMSVRVGGRGGREKLQEVARDSGTGTQDTGTQGKRQPGEDKCPVLGAAEKP